MGLCRFCQVVRKPIFNVLEDSLTVVLANAEDVKGRKEHKTDPKDSW
jgi:hypothetical protein